MMKVKILTITLFAILSGCSDSGATNNGTSGNEDMGQSDSSKTPSSFQLSVTKVGDGSVISSPSGIDCGTNCESDFDAGNTVLLRASVKAGSRFSGWSGACGGTSDCTVKMNAQTHVGASFGIIGSNEFNLNVTIKGGGRVTSDPIGIECGADCSEFFMGGTPVTLKAMPDVGFEFGSWKGDCSGHNCALTMNEDQNVTATFIPITANNGNTHSNNGTNTNTTGMGPISIDDMGTHEISHGDIFTFDPVISGQFTICRKDMGHDDVKVDSETGRITWDTSSLNFGRGFHIRIKCSNFTDSAFASMVVHVDKSGTSQLRIAGQNGVSQYIGVAGRAMTSGDTIVFPDGQYPVSVSKDASYENAFKTNAPTDGSSDQYSTIISQTPGAVVVNGAPHDGIGKQKNAFQLTETNYVAIVGFTVKNVQRESLTAGTSNKLLIEFVGAQGAGTGGETCANFAGASTGKCSKAGMRVNGGTPLMQGCYDWGHNRYGIMTRSTSGSITRRSFVRLDEHKGDQPYGGFSNYCDTLHLSQDNTVFDSLAIAAPHYKNFAGLEAYPATGCERTPSTLKTSGLLAVNNKLSLSLLDSKAGPNNLWEYIVSYDSEGTCTPQTNRCGAWLLQSDKPLDVSDSFFGKTRPFGGGTDGQAWGRDINQINVSVSDVSGEVDIGSVPDYLPRSQLYFRGKSDTFHGDAGYDSLTTTRRWPIPGEDIIAEHMRSYSNPAALKVGGGTIAIDGNRGAVMAGDTMSEYFWGYINDKVPPLVVRVKRKGASNRIAWEHLSGLKRDDVTGWKVMCVDNNIELAALAKEILVYNDASGCDSYGVKATYGNVDSGIAYTEQPQ